MREILFRGKRVDNGEWVEGFLSKVYDKTYISLPLDIAGDSIVTMFDEQQTDAHLYTLAPFLEVVPETVGQFTGRLDKNNQRIFEKHIIKLCGGGHLFCGEVTYSEGTTSYWVENGRLEIYTELGNIKSEFIEVIGNIHDNPELL